MGPGDSEQAAVKVKQIVIDKLAVAAQGRIARSVLEQADVQVVADQLADQLVVQLRSYVTAEHVMKDGADVPFSADVPVQVPERRARWSAFVAFALACAMVAVAVATHNLALALFSGAVAAVGVLLIAEPQDSVPTVAHVTGTVRVDATFYRAFPDAELPPLPPQLGGAVRMVQLDSPLPHLRSKLE